MPHTEETKTDTVSRSRTIAKNILAREQAEGVGARVRRAIGTPQLRNLDPFLMLDHFTVTKPAGFPDHPHRGFETVTYMLEGAVQHEDFCKHHGTIRAGDVQWMTAGRGIVHAEMPAGPDPAIGMQLWVNLAAKDKMVKPSYQELTADKIAAATGKGVSAKIIAGSALGTTAGTVTRTPTMYIDFRLEAGASLQQAIPAHWNAFIYTLEGSVVVGECKPTGPNQMVVLSRDDSQDGVTFVAGKSGSRFLLIAGQPLNEPVVQHGPFVMTSNREIMEAIMDYQGSTNGFEAADTFRSFISSGKDFPDSTEAE